jgi:hypothetical protein
LLTDPEEALPLLARCEPLELWERLEKVDTLYLVAYCARESNFPVLAPTHLDEAAAAYGGVVRELAARRWLRPRKFRTLRAKARLGAARVADAKIGNYDTSWLP